VGIEWFFLKMEGMSKLDIDKHLDKKYFNGE
jgi:hypothetical protein